MEELDNKIKKFITEEEISEEEFNLICEYSKIRYNSKVSQRELAKQTGLSQSTIARLEKNLHSASLATFIKILKVLGYHLEIKIDK